jgi:glycosyltransferase involved in cell wall biosynthesis
MSGATLFTVFTPTYNRAHTLHRAFDSLRAQTLRDFEWLVVDDGSTDNTAKLIAAWAEAADFPIRYVRQDHAGKHFAHNRALKQARGQFLGCLDSDDALTPDALEKLAGLWNSIPKAERGAFYSVGGLCRDQKGSIVGDRFPADPFDASLRELRYVHHIRGDKWRVNLTAVLRRYPFPEIPGTQFVPENVVWMDIAKTYKTRWQNVVVRIYHVDDPETGATLTKRTSLADNAVGRRYYYIWLLNNDLEYLARAPAPFLRAAVMLPLVGWYTGHTIKEALSGLRSPLAKFLVMAAVPFSLLLYLTDRGRSQRPAK